MFELAPAVGMSGNYQIKKSLRFNSADANYIGRIPASASDRKKWTWSAWVKRSKLGTDQYLFLSNSDANNHCFLELMANDTLRFSSNEGAANYIDIRSSAVLRDTASWYHIVLQVDTANAVQADRSKLFVNGTRCSLSLGTQPAGTTHSTSVNNTVIHYIGRYGATSAYYFDGYLSEVNFVDGQALTPDSFGKTDSTTGQWIPKKYTGTYGTNGFYLPFDDGTSTTTIGYDRSGNGLNWSTNAFSVAAGVDNDLYEDTPTNNYATFNAISGVGTSTNGNLQLLATYYQNRPGTMAVSSGKYYFEAMMSQSSGQGFSFGIGNENRSYTIDSGGDANGWMCHIDTALAIATKQFNGTSSTIATSVAANPTIGVALDMDNRKVWFSVNGVWTESGDPATGTNPQFTGLTGSYIGPLAKGGNGTTYWFFNAGQRAFTYTPPTGFKTLCTKNLPTPTIKKPNKYFNAIGWIGNDVGTTRSFTGVGFAPDLVWVKCRNIAYYHSVYDTVRGAGNNSELITNTDGAEGAGNQSEYDWLSSFDADGFTSTYGGVNARAYFNQLNNSYVAWNWKESVTAGFDIVTYTGNGVSGRTVAHGLGVAPSMFIVKNRDGGAGLDWCVWHKDLAGGSSYLGLNQTWAQNTAGDVLTVAPTSSVFSVGSNPSTNQNGARLLCYLFAEVPGFSKFGKYTGNGSADGPFVYCGFTPKYVMVKRVDVADNWLIRDSLRSGLNVVSGENIFPNSGGAEDTFAHDIDFVSNGFKVRGTNAVQNASGGTYIFMAFAEAPYKYSTAR